jgi:hypothetical protein
MPARFVGSWHYAVEFSVEIQKSCTDLGPTLLYILILWTCNKFVRKNKMLALGVCSHVWALAAGLPHQDHVSITTTWGDIFESSFKVQNSNLECLFSLKRGKRDFRTLSFELWNSIRKCHPKWGSAVLITMFVCLFVNNLFCFPNNEFDKLPCKLDSTEYARSFRTKPDPA